MTEKFLGVFASRDEFIECMAWAARTCEIEDITFDNVPSNYRKMYVGPTAAQRIAHAVAECVERNIKMSEG